MNSHLLYGYRTLISTSIGAAPYCLVNEMKSVLPIKKAIPSLRVIEETRLHESEWVKARHEESRMLDEKWLRVLHNVKIY